MDFPADRPRQPRQGLTGFLNPRLALRVGVLPGQKRVLVGSPRDGDGSITLEDSQETMFRAMVAQSNVPFHYGEPRQVRLGIELRF